MDDMELIRTISGTANRGRQGLPAAILRCLSILEERDRARDEAMVEGLAKWLHSHNHDHKNCPWEDHRISFMQEAREAIKAARGGL